MEKKNVNNRGLLKVFVFSSKFPMFIYVALSLIQVTLPGLYMDSVNPDYFAAHIVNPNNVPVWAYPDNILFEPYRYPLLNSLYGGAVPAYIGLAFFEVFGYSVFSTRLLHIIYGLIIIYLCYKTVEFLSKNSKLATIIALVIAIDPTFIFAWRTQYYLQLFPLISFIIAVVLLVSVIKDMQGSITVNSKKLATSGILAGISALGYFIFAFYFIVLFGVLFYYASKYKLKWKVSGIYIPSFLIGYSLFIYAHFSIILNEGLDGYINSLKDMSNAYGVADNLNNGFLDRIIHVKNLLINLPSGDFIANVIFGTDVSSLNIYKMFIPIIILIIIIYIAICFYSKEKIKAIVSDEILIFQQLMILTIIFHITLGIVIGSSLNYQHFIMLLPIFYLVGGIALFVLGLCIKELLTNKTLFAKSVGLCALILLLIFQMNNNIKFFDNLNKTGGVGYYSDSINKVAEYSYNISEDEVMIFPQWGYWMGVATATGGNKEMWVLGGTEQIIDEINRRPIKSAYYIVLEAAMFEKGIKEILEDDTLYLKNSFAINTRDGNAAVIIAMVEKKME